MLLSEILGIMSAMTPSQALSTVRANTGKIRSLEDLMKLFAAEPDQIIGRGSGAVTVALSPEYVIRFLLHPEEQDPWFDGFGKYCMKNPGLTLLPRVHWIVRTKSLGVACMEMVGEVGTLLQKVNQILPTISTDIDLEHLFESIAYYFSGKYSAYQTGKTNLEDLTGISSGDSKELANILLDLQTKLGFNPQDVSKLYFKVIPSLNSNDTDIDVKNENVGWRHGTKELVIFDPVI